MIIFYYITLSSFTINFLCLHDDRPMIEFYDDTVVNLELVEPFGLVYFNFTVGHLMDSLQFLLN